MNEASTDKGRIKNFWNEQGRKWGDHTLATNFDLYGRELELQALLPHIFDGASIIDVGCGNGYLDFEISKINEVQIFGIDFSDELIQAALNRLDSESGLTGCIKFQVNDILQLSHLEQFDIAITTAALINLPSWEDQRTAILRIRNGLKPGGKYLMLENTFDGLDRVNKWRSRLRLDTINQKWHNRYFIESELLPFLRENFTIEKIHHFASTYYAISRCIYPLFVAEPCYHSWVNRFAKSLPAIGEFAPARLYVLRKTCEIK